MPVLSIGEIKYMITLHKKISYNFFYEILDWEIFQAILGKLEEIRIGTGGEFQPQIDPKNPTDI